MPVRTLLIDDESNALAVLRALLKEYIPHSEVVGEARTVSEGVKLITSLKPQLIFLDLHVMGESGLSILDHFEEIDFQVIITTAFDHYALESYKYEVVDYLMKPLSPMNLKKAFDRAEKRISVSNSTASLSHPEKPSEIRIQTQEDGVRYLTVSRIIRLEANRNYTWIYMSGEAPFLVSKTLAKLEKQLEACGFLRTHHSHLVNPDFIQSFDRNTGILSLVEVTEVPVSRERRKQIIEFLARR